MKKFFLIVLTCLLVSALFGGGLSLFIMQEKKASPSLSQAPSPSPVAQSTLRLSPAALTIQAGIPATIQVKIENSNASPTLVQLELSYDPNTVTNVTLTPGDFFTKPVILFSKVSPTSGRISYAISSEEKSTATSGTVATLSFLPIASFANETAISFLPKTIVKQDSGENILNGAYGTTLQFTTIVPSQTATNSAVSF
ncbi:MAG: cohesin domain-containing protein [Patescibacteria group bacterium]